MTTRQRGMSSVAAVSNTSTSFVVPVTSPAPVAGDLLVTFFFDPGNADPTVTPPSGWSLVPNSGVYKAGTPGLRSSAYWKRATGAETSETWTWASTNGALATQHSLYSDATGGTSNIDQAVNTASSGAATTTRTTSALTVGAAELIQYQADIANSSWTVATGTILQQQVRSASLSVLVAISSVTAGTYTRTATASASTGLHVDGLLSITETISAAPTANAGADFTADPNLAANMTLHGVGAPASGRTISSYTWTDITSGGSTVIAGTGSDRTVKIPQDPSGTSRTYRLTVTDNTGAVSAADTVVVTVLPHVRWIMEADGTLTPLRWASP